jgi:hypothetical protein
MLRMFSLGIRSFLLLALVMVASRAGADPQVYTLTGSFNMIAGATGNVVGYPVDARLLPSMTPVGEFTAAATGSLTLDLMTGELLGAQVAVADAAFDLDATWHIPGLPAPPHGTISNTNMSHGASGGELGVTGPGEIDYAAGANFDTATGTAGCSSPFGALFCQNNSIGPFFDVNTGEIFALDQSEPFTAQLPGDDSISVTIVFDTGIVTGDAQAVQTMTLTGIPTETPEVPALGPMAGCLLAGALLWTARRSASASKV